MYQWVIKRLLQKKGINPDNIIELDWGQHYQYNKNTKIIFEPANHWSGRSLFDRNKTLWGSFVIEIAKKKIFFAGDTAFGLGKIFYELHDKYQSFDLALLPIGAYKPTRLLNKNHVNPRQAVHIHQILKAKKSLAIHFGTFRMAQDNYSDQIHDLKLALKQESVSPEDFVILSPGNSIKIK